MASSLYTHPVKTSLSRNPFESWLSPREKKTEIPPLIQCKTLTVGKGSFQEASLIEKVCRVVLTIFLIVITLGLILCFLSAQNILDLDIQPACEEPEAMISTPRTSLPMKDKLNPSAIITSTRPSSLDLIPRDSWDNYTIVHHCQKLHARYPKLLVQGPQPIASCFSLERLLFLDLHLYNPLTGVFLNQPDMSICEHKNYNHLYLEDTPCDSLRIFAYPLWHHPLATTEKEIMQKMLTISNTRHAELSHWCLVIVNLDLREVVYFDSLSGFINNKLINPTLTSIAKRLGKQFPLSPGRQKPFTIKKVVQTPIQSDSFSCGVWITIFLERYLENPQNIPEILNTLHSQKHKILRDFLDKASNPQQQLSSIIHPRLDNK
ncbi:Ulp1 family isopeptidase [Chlamydia avium]|uniref:Ulp1 family isopeptidase n=1 Tax=Chlamydia avium TaxID=1457141 RepID=UPI00035737CF|nr:Ulp1 family isopeptidase [Chlamydia avium]EPP36041.1 ulp1 protease family, C-terminal catalytic domain protein [Chlamydia psittaci 10_743_SC13]